MDRIASDITVSSGINTGPPITFSSPGPSSAPDTPYSSNQPSSTVPAGLSGSESSFNDVANAFFSNKGAVAGVFAGLGVLLVSLCAIIYIGWIHRRRKHHRNQPMEERPNTDIKTHLDPPFPYLGPETPKITSMKSSDSSHRISLANVTEWWTRRRGGRRSSHFQDVFSRSRSPSLVDVKNDVGEEDTQWTLGKVLEDQQRQQVITRPAPVRRTQSPPALLDNRSEGRRFTLEDALFPSLSSSSPTPYKVGSGRHPYAQ